VFNQGLADPQHTTYGAYPEYWDDEAKVPYKRWTEGGVNHFLTYENSNSFDEKIKWLKANGYGGVMIYDLSSIYINNNPSWGGIINYIGDRQKLLKDIKASAFGDSTLPDILPIEFNIFQNYPNPFNLSTKIKYQIPINSHVSLKIYDVLGREVTTLVDEFKAAGYKSIEFSSNSLSSGIYIYKIKASKFVQAKKMLLIK
jgi:hypothetical protein